VTSRPRGLPSAVSDADAVLVTGMSLAKDTLPSILEAARQNHAAVVVWAATGANLAPLLLLDQGADSVVSETFPY
jgi:uncharacterized protein (DUF4213/DUF364 family)